MKEILSISILCLIAFVAHTQSPAVSCSVTTINNEGVPGVSIAAYDENGSLAGTATTDANGNYAFSNLPYPATYTLEASKDGNYAEEVSTFDMVLLKQHILNITPLNSPYKILAGDVNDSGSLSTLDIVLIHKVVLALEDSFPAPSWKFVPTGYVYADPAFPFVSDLSEALTVEATGPDQVCIDFIGIKTGNLNP